MQYIIIRWSFIATHVQYRDGTRTFARGREDEKNSRAVNCLVRFVERVTCLHCSNTLLTATLNISFCGGKCGLVNSLCQG